MVKEASDAGYELPAVFSVEDVFRIFGYRTAEELDRFLSDCPRHYIRVSDALHKSSPQNEDNC